MDKSKGEPGAANSFFYAPVDFSTEKNTCLNIEWFNKLWVRRLLRSVALVSLISVSLHTPKSFEQNPYLRYVTFVADGGVTFLFTFEMVAKIKARGAFKGESAYFQDRWCRFDFFMVACHWISMLLHIGALSGVIERSSYTSVLQAPRPLIMIRFIRVFLKFSMPKSRLNQIFKRSSQQIYNVTLFFTFFMSLYGILGVQFFGELRQHCVKNGTDPSKVTINSLMIPDSYCSMEPDSGYQCPKPMVCMKLQMSRYNMGFNGFDEFATSIFTVYQAASQEGWVFIMYRTMDSMPGWKSVVYFTTLIFFLSWLVKNVFIAVVRETFNEIRVQFQQMWGNRANRLTDDNESKLLKGSDTNWQVIAVTDSASTRRAARVLINFLNSATFHILIIIVILLNAMVMASISYKHDGRPRESFYQTQYYIEVAFTIFFDLETLVKIWIFGITGYLKRSIFKFELLLALGTTIHVIPQFYLSAFTYFQVLRIVRLMKASPLLEDFVYKIFGPGKKLGSLIIFTMCLLIITSSISMQLFCFLRDFTKFETFPEAFMSMFQILTQEAWTEVMDETMLRTSETFAPLVAIYFILYHLFMTLIVLSLFVAVILDNLELDENIKKLKQIRARQQSAQVKESLPKRLAVFEKFPDKPQMMKIHKTPSDYLTPKVRDSFVKSYCVELSSLKDKEEWQKEDLLPPTEKVQKRKLPFFRQKALALSQIDGSLPKGKHETISEILTESNTQRQVLGDSGAIPVSQLAAKQHPSIRKINALKQNSDKQRRMENGDLGSANRSATSRRDQDLDIKLLQAKRQQAEMRRNQREEDLRENHPLFDTPLWIVKRESKFRHFCKVVVDAKYDSKPKDPITGKEIKLNNKRLHNLLGLVTYLEWMMILVTTASCFAMMLETPAYGLIDHWELEAAEYVSLTLLVWKPRYVPQNSGAQILMILRCLRPLRIFVLVPHMRRVVFELCRGFKEILLVSILLIVLMFVFALYGVQLYGGRLARCNDSTIKDRDKCVGVFMRKVFVTKMKIGLGEGESHPQMLVPRVWSNPRRFNFDNIGNAMLALFEVLSFKGWLDIRDVLIKTLGPLHAIYIHIFVFLGCMIGLTLFVGVVIANYSENKGTALLTVDQRRWCDLKKRLKIAQPLHLPPRPDSQSWRAVAYDVTQHIMFKRFMALMVLLNSALLSVSWRAEEDYTIHLAMVSSIFSCVFVFEVVVKIAAFTPRGYWQSRRNQYDCFVTVLGVVWIVTNFTISNDFSHSFGFIVIILRFFTITGKHATLRMLMLTVVVSVYKSFFIIMGMFLLILTYALAGNILFGSVKYGESIGRQANFSTTSRGIIMLFRIVTGEDWYKIMHDCMISPPFCTPGGNSWETDCGNFRAAMMFFCSFYVIITYIVLNLLVETVTGLEVGAESSRVKKESNGSETDKCEVGSFNDTNKKEQKMTRKNPEIKPKRTDEETRSWLKKLENLDENKQ
ncbi:hypothetical protein QYM36_013419 [Artemia franciscana]|uniref:Ion transport domain-containing protein n=1 Tax=Artemia franciscana TaxID=6661 RepID=A0AA88L211_ARTSF|nr:hypothetical protein QYM36_013419 [Artemia franciscana]